MTVTDLPRILRPIRLMVADKSMMPSMSACVSSGAGLCYNACMEKTVKPIIATTLLLLPFAVSIPVLPVAHIIHSPANAVAFLFAYTAFCAVCSVTCGFYAVIRKKTRFQKLAITSQVLLTLSIIAFVLSSGGLALFPLSVLSILFGIACSLVSIVITIFIIIQGERDFLTMCICAAQILWSVFAFGWLFFLSGISA